VIQDDFPALAEEAHGADAVIFAVPVYYWGVPAQLKAFIDRHVHYYGRRKYSARAIGLIIIAADDGIEETEQQMLNFFETGGHAAIPWEQVVVLRGYASDRTEATSNPELMGRARDLGRTLAARLS
jgi:multimeric flavodoxin WrbA